MSPREVTEDSGTVLRNPRGDVLAWATMDLADAPELRPQAFDVHLMIDEAARCFACAARDKGLLLEVKTAPTVPLRALGEAAWLREILFGLLDNAVRFTDRGEVIASVTSSHAGGRRALLHAEISDTGRGIPEAVLDRLFRLRPDSPTADGGGRVHVARRLIELMDGEIGCSSAVGMGTTSWFSVPLDLPSA